MRAARPIATERAPHYSSTTCAGTPTGAVLSYDNEGRMTSWQNALSSPTTTDQFLYDGEGSRVEQQVTASGTTTTYGYLSNTKKLDTARLQRHDPRRLEQLAFALTLTPTIVA